MKHLNRFTVMVTIVTFAVLVAIPAFAIGLIGNGAMLVGIAGATTEYGDISPRTAAFAQKDLLRRGIPHMVFEKFGQAKPVPSNKSKVTVFRRYEALSATPNALTEGVTPASKTLTHTDITATLVQYGDLTTITDIIFDTHEDPVLKEAIEILGEQAAQMIEIVRYGILKAGTNVFYSGTAADRSEVVATISTGLQRQVIRTLKRQNARTITKIVRSTPAFNTENVAPAFIAICHVDLEGDISNMAGFKPAEDYGSLTPYENELGKVGNVRYLTTTVMDPFADAGGIAATMLATTNSAVAVDVYPILYIAADAYGIVPLKGKSSITPTVVNPTPSKSDPLGQRGHAGWKSMQTCCILNDAWMCRAEVTASLNPAPA